MAIIVKDYTWQQTEKTVNIKVPLKAVSHEKVDIFTTDEYLKAHFKPFLFEIFLLHDVDIRKSKCLIEEEIITFDLEKKEEVVWNTLEKDLSKDDKKEIRQRILEKCQEEAQKELENKRIKKNKLNRFAVQRAMEIDNQHHNLIDSRKNAERSKAMNDLEEWRQKKIQEKYEINEVYNTKDAEVNEWRQSKLHEDVGKVTITEISDKNEEKNNLEVTVNTNGTLKKRDEVKPKKDVKKKVTSDYVDKKKKECEKRILPKLRECCELEITHTKRTFPTPSRESQANEEEQWLRNVTLARRATGFVSEDLRPEEQDPQWCKEKGDEFFKLGNYLGAISAYTHGITLSNKLPSLFANRAATQFALGNFNKCVQDCSTALELLVPPCEGNRKSRAKCIARRGAALTRLGFLSKGIDEMKAAAKLLPEDESLKQDIYDMERAWEQNPDSD